MRVIPLSEGVFTVDQSKKMVPFNQKEDSLKERNTGSLLVAITPFLIINSHDIILLDTGLGVEQNGKNILLQHLQENGIAATDITKVLLSHLHTDHTGGMSYINEQGTRQMTFPNAQYFIQKDELAYALNSGTASYKPENLAYLVNHPQVQLIEGNGNIDGYIYYTITGAHSKYHQVFWIEEDHELFFYGADDAPQLAQMKSKFAAKYDYDGKKAMNLRQEWWDTGKLNKWTFLFYHDVNTPIYQPD